MPSPFWLKCLTSAVNRGSLVYATSMGQLVTMLKAWGGKLHWQSGQLEREEPFPRLWQENRQAGKVE
eukprot:3698711-Amphidinium_carterae.1